MRARERTALLQQGAIAAKKYVVAWLSKAEDQGAHVSRCGCGFVRGQRFGLCEGFVDIRDQFRNRAQPGPLGIVEQPVEQFDSRSAREELPLRLEDPPVQLLQSAADLFQVWTERCQTRLRTAAQQIDAEQDGNRHA